MLANTLDTLKEDRAKFARDVEYLKETAIDDVLDERMEVAESLIMKESIDELEEAANMVKKMRTDDYSVMESEEIDRIMNATEDLTFDEMVGIANQ